jgi:hypothetical protein
MSTKNKRKKDVITAEQSRKTQIAREIGERFVNSLSHKVLSGSCNIDGCHPALGPSFGGTGDLSIGAYADFENGSNSYDFGREYTNDTGLGGKPGDSTFSYWFELFTVKEIEVFEITD